MAADLLARVRGEIHARMTELRPAIAEYQRLLGAAEALERDASAAGVPTGEALAGSAKRSRASRAEPTRRAAVKPTRRAAAKPTRESAAKATRASQAEPARRAGAKATRRAEAKPTAAQLAIVAALEHGSHTVAELVVVTAMPGGDIRDGLRRLQRAGTVTRSSREGRIAYVLSGVAA